MLLSTPELTKIAEILFIKSGLAENINYLVDTIEYEFLVRWGDTNEYGEYDGCVDVSYAILKDGNFEYHLEDSLNSDQKDMLLRLSLNNSIVLEIDKTSSRKQTWELTFNIPEFYNDINSKSFKVDLTIDINNSGNGYWLKAVTRDDVTEDEISKFAMMYVLQHG